MHTQVTSTQQSPRKVPVVFMFFNRPEVTRAVFERIRDYQPTELFLVSDGARATREGEALKVQQTRDLVDARIDWPCTVHRDYAPANLGCRNRIASGLNWVFSQVEEAIILEDDCLPIPDFFTFCERLLERYRHDERVMHIGGCNYAHRHTRSRDTYWFSRHAAIWGWATWRRAWEKYDFKMKNWEARKDATTKSFASNWEGTYWMQQWKKVHDNIETASTWDFQWMFSCRSSGSFNILPSGNLIENLGIGNDATHTGSELNHLELQASPLGAWRDPGDMKISRYKDELYTRVYLNAGTSFVDNLKSRLRILKKRWRER